MLTPIMKNNRDRRTKVARLYIRGHSLQEIVQALGIEERIVARELVAIRKEWVDASGCERTEAKARELAKLDLIESEAWRAWERSQKDSLRVKTTEKQNSVFDKETAAETKVDKMVAKETVSQTQVGDPKFLATAQRAIDRRSAILGVAAARKSAPADDDADVITFHTFLDHVDAASAMPPSEPTNVIDVESELARGTEPNPKE